MSLTPAQLAVETADASAIVLAATAVAMAEEAVATDTSQVATWQAQLLTDQSALTQAEALLTGALGQMQADAIADFPTPTPTPSQARMASATVHKLQQRFGLSGNLLAMLEAFLASPAGQQLLAALLALLAKKQT